MAGRNGGVEIEMSDTELLLESLRLLVVGMGIVFAFLLLLVGILRGMSAVVLRIAPLEAHPAAGPAPHPADSEPGDLVAVITAAVARYRANR